MRVITKLSIDTIKSHKLRSLVICVAVVLTTLLFMVVMSITFSIFGGFQLMLQLAGGSDFHASIQINDFDNVSAEEILNRVKKNGAVSEAYILLSDIEGNIEIYKSDSIKAAKHMFMTITDGIFPQTENEIAVNSRIYPDAVIGQNITILNNDYTVSGVFESEANDNAQCGAMGLCNPSDSEKCKFGSIYIIFNNTLNIQGKLDMLADSLSDISGGNAASGMINSAFITAKSNLTFENMVSVFFVVAVVFFCAFLLIFNIYSIALTQDIEAFSLLCVIGTTYKQLKKLISRSAVILYALSMPIGLILGYFIGWKLISPIFMTMSGDNINYRFSMWIPVISAVLTFITLLYSAHRPLKRIKKLTPIETVHYSDVIPSKKKKSVNQKRAMNTIALAISSVGRNPKRLLITSMSIALSIISFFVIASLVSFIKLTSITQLMIPDIVLEPVIDMSMNGKSGEPENTIDEEIFEKIKAINAANEINTIRITSGTVDGNAQITEDAKNILEKISDISKHIFDYSPIERAAKGKIDAIFLSIPDQYCKYIKLSDDENYSVKDGFIISLVSPSNMRHIVYQKGNGEEAEFTTPTLDLFSDGDTVKSNILSKDYKAISVNAKNARDFIRRICGSISWKEYTQIFILPSSIYEKEFGKTPIYKVLCDIDGENVGEKITGEDKEFRAEVDEIVFDNTYDSEYKIEVRGRIDGLEELGTRLYAMRVTGYSLSAIIFLIGIINMANSAFTAVILRRREYAMLEAVGMTDKQLKNMMLFEGLVGGTIATVMSMLVGIPLMMILIKATFHADISFNPVIPFIMLCLLFAISTVVSLLTFRMTKKSSLTERLKTEE